MLNWLNTLSELAQRAEPVVLVTVLETRGSVPREAGTKMLATADQIFGTIGGGNLEYQCIQIARQRLLDQQATWQRTTHYFPLAVRLGQCCGGLVVVLLEYFNAAEQEWFLPLQESVKQGKSVLLITALHENNQDKQLVMDPQLVLSEPGSELPEVLQTHYRQALSQWLGSALSQPSQAIRLSALQKLPDDKRDYLLEFFNRSALNIVLFGAGHVGKALVQVLAELECQVTWVDSRTDQFPADIPVNTQKQVTAQPETWVQQAPANSCFLVMTHSHALDQQLCEAVLQRGDFLYCGLIGSLTKRRKFEQRMRVKGFSDTQLQRLVCPIGLPEISGKQPAVIAVSVAAQLLAGR